MFHAKSEHSYMDLFKGIIIGGSLAAAATFIFGTKKGKELQKEFVHQYKKFGRTTKDMKRKFEHAIHAQIAKKVKRTLKSKKSSKKIKAKIHHIKKHVYRKAA